MWTNMLQKIIRQTTKHYKWTLAGIIGLFSAIVLGNMTRWSIWFDEAFSAYLMRFNFVEITQFTAVDVHPPLYYWLLKVWTSVFGMSELGVRSMSLVFAIVAIIGVFVLVRRLFNSPSVALLASLAMALSPMIVRFAHEARMYTVVLAIVIWATYLLLRAMESGQKRWWVGYAVLVAAGMFTHYFAAMAWLGHWAWRWYEKRSGRLKQFWTKPWVWTHVLAVGLFSPWIYTAVKQFVTVQGGFWIPPVSAYTPIDYLSNTVLYREYGAVLGWWAVLFMASVVAGVWLFVKMRQKISASNKRGVALLTSMAVVPPILLVILSMPPLKSSFIDRYVMYSQALTIVLVAVAIAWAYRRKLRGTMLAASVIGLALVTGIGNVYYYGNYNKNSNTSIRVKEAIQQVQASGEAGQPIIAATPWIYYEASFYDTADNHVYFLNDSTNYQWGSLAMLRDRPIGKINDLDKFTDTYRYVWYLGANSQGDVTPPVDTWRQVKAVGAYDYINDSTVYRASLFDTRPNEE